MKKTALFLLPAIAVLSCAKKTALPLPAELAPFASHLTFKSDQDVADPPANSIHNRYINYDVDLSFDQGVAEFTPIMEKAGFRALPVQTDSVGHKSITFVTQVGRPYSTYVLESVGDGSPRKCILVHDIAR